MTETKREEIKKFKVYYKKEDRQALEKAIEMNIPALLVGDTGTGKTSMIRDLAIEQKKELIRLNLTGQTGVDEFIGKVMARVNGHGSETYWQDGLLVMAMKIGAWVVLDEINMALPEILSALHSLLDDDRKIILKEKGSSVELKTLSQEELDRAMEDVIVRPHQDFRLFATMNPSDDYAGTKELNKAFLSRFGIVLNVDYSDQEVEILTERTGVSGTIASELVMVAKDIRHNRSKSNLTYPCSTRDLISCAELIATGLSKPLAYRSAIINKAPTEERIALEKIIKLVTDTEVRVDSEGVKVTIAEALEKFSKMDKEVKDAKKEATEFKKSYNEVNDQIKIAKKKLTEINQAYDLEKKKNDNLRKKLTEFLELAEGK